MSQNTGIEERALRLAAANKLLATLPTPAQLYDTQAGLRLFLNRIGTGFPNVDIAAVVNFGNGFFMLSKRSVKRANLPWGSTVERTISGLVTWVNEGHAWRDGYWDEMVRHHGHWLSYCAVAEFIEATQTAEVSR